MSATTLLAMAVGVLTVLVGVLALLDESTARARAVSSERGGDTPCAPVVFSDNLDADSSPAGAGGDGGDGGGD